MSTEPSARRCSAEVRVGEEVQQTCIDLKLTLPGACTFGACASLFFQKNIVFVKEPILPVIKKNYVFFKEPSVL